MGFIFLSNESEVETKSHPVQYQVIVIVNLHAELTGWVMGKFGSLPRNLQKVHILFM